MIEVALKILWVANIDGSNPKQLTKSNDGQFASPIFSNDGNYVYVSQTSWAKGTFEIWMYHINGGIGYSNNKIQSITHNTW